MAKKVNIEITNPVGLYASPATELVDAVKLYKSHVTLNYNEKSVNMKMSLLIENERIAQIVRTLAPFASQARHFPAKGKASHCVFVLLCS